MTDFEAAFENAYLPPLRQLLWLGEPRGKERHEWRDYSALGISPATAPDLIRMSSDEALHNAPQKSKIVWAPVHAWRALGQLRATEAIAPLLALFQRADVADDWVMTDLPEALARMGAPVIEPVANYLADTTRGEWARVAAANVFSRLGRVQPELRGECVKRAAAQLEKFAEQPEIVNTFLTSALWDLRAVEAIQVIERAFASGRVDESVNGDFEDVQIHLGLKPKREHPRKPNSLTKMSRELAGLREEIEIYEKENAELRTTFEVTENIIQENDLSAASEFDIPEPYIAPQKVGRNEPCPCGSGRKYKKCCGA